MYWDFVELMLEFATFVLSKKTRPNPRDHLSHYVSFTGGRCGSMRELPMQFVLHVFIRLQGTNLFFFVCKSAIPCPMWRDQVLYIFVSGS